ncbi:MAG: MBOAT family O-acyltransferase [Anaerorhabdus sp.]
MVFSSLSFLYGYLPLAILIIKLVPRKLRNAALFVMSLLFYGWGEPIYIVLMLISTGVDYINGLMVHRYHHRKEVAFRFVLFSVIFNIGLLSFFKYFDFIVANLNSIGITGISPLGLALPLGISFYTFQTMSYPIDVYRQEAQVQKNILSFGAYVSMFPQLIAGPIVRYKTIADQLENRKETQEQFYEGILRFSVGLSKKVLLANTVGAIWIEIQSLALFQQSVMTAWIGLLAYGFQIYFDFSGYSDMAIGLGKMLGFEFPENFNYPYIAQSISDFWRRWHMTLGEWFRDCIYIPLGGSRKGSLGFNLLMVWFLTGLWHGASWNFILWGLYFWVFIYIEKKGIQKLIAQLPQVCRHLYTLFVVLIGWVLFYFTSWGDTIQFLKLLFGCEVNIFANEITWFYVRNYAVLWVALILASIPQTKCWFAEKILRKHEYLIPILIVVSLVVCTAFLVDASYNPFLYFRF